MLIPFLKVYMKETERTAAVEDANFLEREHIDPHPPS